MWLSRSRSFNKNHVSEMVGKHRQPQRYACIYINIYVYIYIYTRCIELAPILYEDLHGSPMAHKKLLEVPDVADMKLLGCVSSFFLFGFGSSSQLWTSKMVDTPTSLHLSVEPFNGFLHIQALKQSMEHRQLTCCLSLRCWA